MILTLEEEEPNGRTFALEDVKNTRFEEGELKIVHEGGETSIEIRTRVRLRLFANNGTTLQARFLNPQKT